MNIPYCKHRGCLSIRLADGDFCPAHLHRAPAVQKSSFDGWNTPPNLVALLKSFGLDGVSLDPCSNASSVVGAALSRGKAEDGLGEDWRALLAGINREGGLVYVNPPYDSPTLLRVVKHCAKQAAEGVEIIALVPAKVDQSWWQDWVIPHASALCFLRGRVKFWREGAPWQGASSPCILLYWGRDSAAFCEHFAGVGRCLDLALVPAEETAPEEDASEEPDLEQVRDLLTKALAKGSGCGAFDAERDMIRKALQLLTFLPKEDS